MPAAANLADQHPETPCHHQRRGTLQIVDYRPARARQPARKPDCPKSRGNMIRTDCMRGDAGVGYHLQKGSYDLRDARRDCYTPKQKQKKHGGSTRRSTATSESDLPENQIPAAVFKGCPISLAVHPPARLFPYVVPVSRAGAGVSELGGAPIPGSSPGATNTKDFS